MEKTEQINTDLVGRKYDQRVLVGRRAIAEVEARLLEKQRQKSASEDEAGDEK